MCFFAMNGERATPKHGSTGFFDVEYVAFVPRTLHVVDKIGNGVPGASWRELFQGDAHQIPEQQDTDTCMTHVGVLHLPADDGCFSHSRSC